MVFVLPAGISLPPVLVEAFNTVKVNPSPTAVLFAEVSGVLYLNSKYARKPMPKGQTPDTQGLQITLESPVPVLYMVPEVLVPPAPVPRSMVPVVVFVVTEAVAAVVSLGTIVMDDVPPELPVSPEPPPITVAPPVGAPVIVLVTPKFLSQV